MLPSAMMITATTPSHRKVCVMVHYRCLILELSTRQTAFAVYRRISDLLIHLTL